MPLALADHHIPKTHQEAKRTAFFLRVPSASYCHKFNLASRCSAFEGIMDSAMTCYDHHAMGHCVTVSLSGHHIVSLHHTFPFKYIPKHCHSLSFDSRTTQRDRQEMTTRMRTLQSVHSVHSVHFVSNELGLPTP